MRHNTRVKGVTFNFTNYPMQPQFLDVGETKESVKKTHYSMLEQCIKAYDISYKK